MAPNEAGLSLARLPLLMMNPFIPILVIRANTMILLRLWASRKKYVH